MEIIFFTIHSLFYDLNTNIRCNIESNDFKIYELRVEILIITSFVSKYYLTS